MARPSLWMLVAIIAVALGTMPPVPRAIPWGCAILTQESAAPDAAVSYQLVPCAKSDRQACAAECGGDDCAASCISDLSTECSSPCAPIDATAGVVVCVCVSCHCGIGTLTPRVAIEPPRVEPRSFRSAAFALHSIDPEPFSPPPEIRPSLA